MAELAADRTYLAKAAESLAGAEREFAAGAYNNCANRAYYACFQAAIAALIRVGIGPSPRDHLWRHDAVQSQFNEQVINRRKLYPSNLRGTLETGSRLRNLADYGTISETEIQVARALRRARAFVSAIGDPRGTLR